MSGTAAGNAPMCVDIPVEMKAELRDLAKRTDVPAARIVRRALHQYLAAHKQASELSQQAV
jgi:predicted transcriptional regulator